MRKFLVVLGVVLLSAVVASANGVGVFGSYWDTKDADSGYGGGAKLQMDIMPNICVEARGSYFPDFGDSSGDEIKLDIIPLEADAIIKFPIAEKLTPYVGGGAGYYMFEVDNNVEGVDISIDDEFGFFALAGLEIGLGEQVVLFAEGKYTWLDATVKAKGGGMEDEETGTLDGFGGNAGLMLKW
jgi:opacity protein-like surface antigen